MTECECSEDYGPCEDHSEVLAQREGAAVRTSDELLAVFVGDVMAILASETGRAEDLLPGGSARETAADYWRECPNGGWAPYDNRETYSLSKALADARDVAESLLPADVYAWWDDGYVIARLTGGPLAD